MKILYYSQCFYLPTCRKSKIFEHDRKCEAFIDIKLRVLTLFAVMRSLVTGVRISAAPFLLILKSKNHCFLCEQAFQKGNLRNQSNEASEKKDLIKYGLCDNKCSKCVYLLLDSCPSEGL